MFHAMASVVICPSCRSLDVVLASIDEPIAIYRCNACPIQFTIERLDTLASADSRWSAAWEGLNGCQAGEGQQDYSRPAGRVIIPPLPLNCPKCARQLRYLATTDDD